MFLTREAFCRLAAYLGDAAEHIDVPPPAVFKPHRLWTGKQVCAWPAWPTCVACVRAVRVWVACGRLCVACVNPLVFIGLIGTSRPIGYPTSTTTRPNSFIHFEKRTPLAHPQPTE